MLNRNIFFTTSLLLIVFIFSFPTFAQDYSGNIWNGLRFNKSDSTANIDNSVPSGIGSGAVAVDPVTGRLLFYTDGQNVYDATHQIMPGGPLNGNPALNQTAVVVPDPGNPGRYIIYTNTPTGVQFSVVNMNNPGNASAGQIPLGEITISNQNTGITNASEAMAVFSAGSPLEYYLVIQNTATNTLEIHEINASGALGASVSAPLTAGMTASNISLLKMDDGTIKLSVAASSNHEVALFTYQPSSNTLTSDGTVAGSTGPVYDTEWAADGRFLYISTVAGQVYQYDSNNPTDPLVAILPNPTTASYGLQRGPDNQIYHIYESGGNLQLGRINNPDSVSTAVVYEPTPFTPNNFNDRQFSSFLPGQERPFTVTINVTEPVCQNSVVTFFPSWDSEPAPTEFTWNFGDSITHAVSPSFMFEEPGTYPVTLTARRGSDEATAVYNVIVVANDLTIDLGADTVICPGETLVLDIGNDVASQVNTITWSDGGINNTPTGQSITVDTTGVYWVTATVTANNCKLYDAIQVELYEDEFQRMNVWYFGNQAGLDFNPDPNDPNNTVRALDDGQMTAPEGTATISDQVGNLLLYTNGQELWGVDRATGDHVLLDPDIGGSPEATQSSIIVPHPGDETLYYVFTVESTNDAGTDNVINLTYTLVDIKAGTAGEVIEKNVPLFSPAGEKITAVEAGEGYVLLAHEMGTNTFYAFPITQEGIGAPVLSSVGSEHSLFEPGNAEGYMEFSADGTKVAVSLSGPENTVEVFDFDPVELTLSNPMTVTFDEPYDEYQVYGLEFSQGTNKLFVSVLSDNGSVIYEVRVDSLDQQYMQRTIAEVSGSRVNQRLGAIQRAPNGNVYVAVDGSNVLGLLQVREDTAQVSSFDFDNLILSGTSTLGLPNVVQSFGLGPQEPAIMISGAQCVGSTVTFGASTTSSIDVVTWAINQITSGGSQPVDSSTEEEFELDFAVPGTYEAILNITNRCGFDTTMIQQFEIFDNPAPPTLSAVSVICIGGSVTLDADNLNRSGMTFLWSTGDTTKTLEVTQPGNYNVSITDANGCPANASTEVVDSSPNANVGPDQTVCQFEPVADLPSGVPTPLLSDFTINWFINDQSSGNSNTISVATDVPGVFTYVAEITDLLTSCSAYDTAVITVNVQPDLTISSNPVSTCDANDGQLLVTANPQNYNFEWFDSSNNPVVDPSAVAGGVYNIVITDPTSGCTNTKNITVVEPALFNITNVRELPACGGGQIEFSLSNLGPGSVDILYNVYATNAPGVVLSGQQTVPTTTTTIATDPNNLVSIGDYTLEVEVRASGSTAGCRLTQNISIVGLPQTTFSLRTNSTCRPNGELEVYGWNGTGQPSIDWTLPDGSLANTHNPVLGNLSTDGKYVVSVKSQNLCAAEDSVDLVLRDGPSPSIASEGGCDGNVAAVATPANAIRYQWSTGVNTTTPRISFNSPGVHPVSVTVYDDAGCSATANAEVVAYPTVMAQISSSIACADENPIILTASGNQQGLTFDWYVGGQRRQTSPNYTIPAEFENSEIQLVASIGPGCTGEDRITVVRRPLTPVEGLQEVYTYCTIDGEFVPFDINPTNISEFSSYVWKDQSTGNEVYYNRPLQVFQNVEGEFLGVFTNEYSCVTEFEVTLNNDCLPVVYAPNAFSPNNDGKNDRFVVFPRYITEFEIFIFSRWGEMLFYSDQLDFVWDGTFNGEVLPVGTYPYLMRYRSLTDPNRGVIEQRGGVLLLK